MTNRKQRKESEVPELEVIDLVDLLEMDFGPEPPEEAYRRGYRDAMLVLWGELTIPPDEADALEHFIHGPLLKWMKGDVSKKVLPPAFNNESEA